MLLTEAIVMHYMYINVCNDMQSHCIFLEINRSFVRSYIENVW